MSAATVLQGSDGRLRRPSGKVFSLADEQKRANKELRKSMKKMLKEQKATDKKERKAARKSMKKTQAKGLTNTVNSNNSQGRKTLGAIQEMTVAYNSSSSSSATLLAPKLYAADEPGATATPLRVKHNPLRRPSLINDNVDGTVEGPLSPMVPKGVAARNGGKWKSKAWKTPSPAKIFSSPQKRGRHTSYTPRRTSVEYRGLLELDDDDADIFAPADGETCETTTPQKAGRGDMMGSASMLASITEGTEINPIHAAAEQRAKTSKSATRSPKTESSGFFSRYNDEAKASTAAATTGSGIGSGASRPMLAPSPLGATPLKKRGSWFSRKTPSRNPPLTPKSYGATEDALAVLPSPGGGGGGGSNVKDATHSESPFTKAANIMQRAKSFMTRSSKSNSTAAAAAATAAEQATNEGSSNEAAPLSPAPAPVVRKKSWFANTPLGKVRSKGSTARLKAANVEKIQKLGAFRY